MSNKNKSKQEKNEEKEGEGLPNGQKTISDKLQQNPLTIEEECLETHNIFRTKHKVPPLELNEELNKIAKAYAQKIAKSGDFKHSKNEWKGEKLGENLFMCQGYPLTGKEMTESWYSEIKDYKFGRKTNKGTGHFTQLVWKSSHLLGVGYATAKDGTNYGVCNYYPAGNFIGHYDSNVLSP